MLGRSRMVTISTGETTLERHIATLRDITMRKMTLLGLMALAVAALSHEQAGAWINFKFGVGLNWNWQSGGNNTLWGLFRNGQPPGGGAPYDPSICPNTGCFNTGNSGGGCGNPYGGYGGYGTGMNQPGFCPQQVPQQQPCSTQPCPSFPGFHPYQNNEFQYFGGQPATPSNAADPSRQNVMAAQSGNPQYQYQAGYFSPYAGAAYYPSYPAMDPYYYTVNYYYNPGYYNPYGQY